MARTIAQIYDSIITEKQNFSELSGLQPTIDSAQTLLNDLTSSSKVAIWRLLVFCVSVGIWIHEKLWDVFKSDVDAIVEAAIPGTAKWYREICLDYQHGDEMSYSDYKYIYEVIDATKQIIQRASATEQGGNILIKVAKLEDGVPVKLLTDELDAFKNYIQKMKFAGTYCIVISDDADLANIAITIYYDPSVMNSSGELLSDSSIKPVEEAIENYIASLPWNGILYKSALVDAAQSAAGVDDVVLNAVQAKTNAATSYQTVERIYQTYAGYLKINELNITYISV